MDGLYQNILQSAVRAGRPCSKHREADSPLFGLASLPQKEALPWLNHGLGIVNHMANDG